VSFARRHLDAAKDRWLFCLALALVILIDQLAKAAVQLFLAYTPPELIETANAAPGVSKLIWFVNTDVFPPQSKWPMLVGSVLFYGVFLHHGAFRLKSWRKLTPVPLAMFVGGALSNVIDILVLGGVRNFLWLGFDNPLSEFIPAIPARHSFSTAALFMTIGIVALPLTLSIEHWLKPKEPPPPPPATGKRAPMPRTNLPASRPSRES